MELINVLYLLIAVLAGGTIFAWINFYRVTMQDCKGCSIGAKGKPDYKCFIGAVFFTVALALAIYALILV
ncbi:MAG: hypothetical protein ABH826_03975 [Patescibacteria group bacterium]|nr:hypothetical protein [Patescibacteria group bacterium]